MTLSLTVNETLQWLSSLPILMQKSFWWWQCSDRYISPPPPPLPPPFSLSLISLMVPVDVKHHDFYGLLTLPCSLCQGCHCQRCSEDDQRVFTVNPTPDPFNHWLCAVTTCPHVGNNICRSYNTKRKQIQLSPFDIKRKAHKKKVSKYYRVSLTLLE